MTKALLEKATEYCVAHQYRLTKPRLTVLKIIASSGKPLSAYEVLEKLGKTLPNPKPPTAYRAIEFWQGQGFVHRIESLNAYVICHAGHLHQGGQFMICDDCGTVIEAHLCNLPKQLQDTAKKNTFHAESWNLEIHGLCEECQSH